MTTYTDYLRDRVLAASVADQAQLEHLIHGERTLFWQRLVSNPAYDERGRLAALAQFDEAAGVVFSEQAARFARPSFNGQPQGYNGHPAQPHLSPVSPGKGALQGGALPSQNPRLRGELPLASRPEGRRRSLLRDLFFLLVGAALGFATAYFAQGALSRVLVGASASPPVEGLTLSQKSFQFVRSQPSGLEGKVTVDYARGARPEDYTCKVEATNKQVLEYVRFDSACKAVAFKFLPLSTLWDNFNYLQGYVIFSTTITSSSGKTWEGTASVYFTVDATA
jgi:hypothetical protein